MDKFVPIDDCVGKTIKDVYHDSSNAGFLFEDGTYTSFEVYRDYDDCASMENNKLSMTDYPTDIHVKMELLSQEELDKIHERHEKNRKEELIRRELIQFEALKRKYGA